MSDSSEFLNVDDIVRQLAIKPGQHAADLGTGSGFFVPPLARAVGKDGVVIAVDVMQEALESVQGRAQGMGLENVRTVHADLEVLGGTKIADNSQDVVLIKNVLFQSKKKDAIIREASRITKPGGMVVVIDWAKGRGGLGPPDALRTDAQEVAQMCSGSGLRQDRQLALDRFHFGVVFLK